MRLGLAVMGCGHRVAWGLNKANLNLDTDTYRVFQTRKASEINGLREGSVIAG